MICKEDLLDLINVPQLKRLMNMKKKEEIAVKKKCSWKCVLGIIAAIAAIAGIAYALYKYFASDYKDDFLDDFDDDFGDDDLFEDEVLDEGETDAE